MVLVIKHLGAPNLTNNQWLYGSSYAQVAYTIQNGRNGIMPAWKDILGHEKVHLVAAYIYSLNNKEADAMTEKQYTKMK